MVLLLVAFLFAMLAVIVRSAPAVWRISGGGRLLQICGITRFIACVFVAFTAVGGGITLLVGMDKFPAEWLIGTPFSSYLIPGVILAGLVGGSAVAAAVITPRIADDGALISILAGAILLGWLAGERVILPKAAFPTQCLWLEAVYVAAGLMMVVPALPGWLAARRR